MNLKVTRNAPITTEDGRTVVFSDCLRYECANGKAIVVPTPEDADDELNAQILRVLSEAIMRTMQAKGPVKA
jgi:hypothetical protein